MNPLFKVVPPTRGQLGEDKLLEPHLTFFRKCFGDLSMALQTVSPPQTEHLCIVNRLP
jgi:hypothetical protein